MTNTSANIKSKQKDWFDEHICDEETRELFKMYLGFYRKIESQFGFVRMQQIKEWSIKSINHQNYKETWEGKPEKLNAGSTTQPQKPKEIRIFNVANVEAETDRYFMREIYNVAAKLIKEKGESYKPIALSWLRKIGKEENFNQIENWQINQ